MRVYGIPNCSSVKKALDFLKANGIEHEFIDFKKQKPTASQIEAWASAVSMDRLFNTKGTKYKSMNIDYNALSDNERIEWLSKEPIMIKRPIIEYKSQIIVGFDEEIYKEAHLINRPADIKNSLQSIQK